MSITFSDGDKIFEEKKLLAKINKSENGIKNFKEVNYQLEGIIVVDFGNLNQF